MNPILVEPGVQIHLGINSNYYYLLYKITNLINGHFYIGVHATTEPYDSYMGSGYSLKWAKKKYGSKNFQKTIIFCADTEEQMYKKEAEIVNSEFIKRKDTYNQSLGGRGSKHTLIQTTLVEIGGVLHTKKEWCQIYNKQFSQILSRMHDFNMTFEEALFKKSERKSYIMITFMEKTMKINQWSMETGITRDRIWKRYNKGCTNEEIFKEYIDNGYKPIIRKEIYKKKITFMGETKSIYEWERITNIPSDIIKRRFIENLPVEQIFKEYVNR